MIGFNRTKRQDSEDIGPCSTHRASAIYSIAAGSYSGSGIESIAADSVGSPPPTSALRRSKTAPSRRDKYGIHEPQQIVHVNRALSQRKF
jgi:hypothetical protein